MAVFLVLYMLFFLSALIQKGKRSPKKGHMFFVKFPKKSLAKQFFFGFGKVSKTGVPRVPGVL